MSSEASSPAGPAEPKIFISYRREETSAYAGRIYDAMVSGFGESNVFMDVDLAPGVDFVERITDVVAACHVLIVVIGPKWATVEDEQGGTRIADPEDFVRLEVETALRRSDVTLIPVLVSGARMPERQDLPEGVQPITRRNAIELSDGRWRYDVGRLMDRLKELLVGGTAIHETVAEPPQPAAPRPTPPSRPTPYRLFVEGVLVAAIIGLVAGGLANALPSELSDHDQVLKRVATWLPVAVGLAIWLTYRFGQRTVARNILLAVVVGVLAAGLSGVISFYPEQKSSDTAITVPTYAVLGAGLGWLLGALWVPRAAAIGLAAGIAAGLLVGLVVPVGQGLPVLWVTVRSVAIVGICLIALLVAGAQGAKSAADPG